MTTKPQARRLAKDQFNGGWYALGLLIPIVGLILWLVNLQTTPLRAKSAGYGALCGALILSATGFWGAWSSIR